MESLNCPICQEYFKNVVETPWYSFHSFRSLNVLTSVVHMDSALSAWNQGSKLRMEHVLLAGASCLYAMVFTLTYFRTHISIFDCTPNKLVQVFHLLQWEK